MFGTIKKFLIRERFMLLVTGLCAVAVVGTTRALLIPRYRYLQEIRSDIGHYRRFVESDDGRSAILEEVRAKRVLLERKLRKFAAVEERPVDIPGLLKFLNDKLDRAGIEFITMKPQRIERKTGYIRYPIVLDIKADYHELGRFVGSLEELPQLIKVERIAMTATGARMLDAKVLITCYLAEAPSHE